MSSIMSGLPVDEKGQPVKLTQEQENKLARMGTEEARNELCLHAMHEAVPYARKVCRSALPDGEIFSLCWGGLMKAAKAPFKPGVTRFFAYAKVSVRRAICDEWRSKDVVKNSSVNESEPRYTNQTHHNGYEDGTFRADGDYPENLMSASPEGNLNHYEFDTRQNDPDIVDQIDIAERWKIVEPIMREKLSKIEFMTLDLHYRGEMNFQEIADLLKVVREATRLAHIRALKKLRSELRRRKALL